ncbi:glycosyltransferase family 2 protein [bacterium]|nr:glycosyltransferase family 2 protein [bacterium]
MKKKKVSIIIPAFNEEESVPLLIAQFLELKAKASFDFEVIFVDDGSTDNTFQVASGLSKKNAFLKVFSHRTNFGITKVLETGFKQSSGEIFVFFPADLQFLASDIPKLVSPIIEGDADLVTGRKEGRYEKKFVSQVYNTLSRLLFRVGVKDLNSIKAFRKEVVEGMALRKDWHRYLVVLAANEGWRIGEVDVTLTPRRFGKSKFGFWRIPIGVLDMISVAFLLRYSRKPMLLFGTLGGASLFSGVIAGIVAIFLRVFGTGFRPLLYLVILLILVGLLLIVAGFIAEQVAQLRAEFDLLKRSRH